MNTKQSVASVSGIALLLVGGLMATVGTTEAQEYFPGYGSSSGCAGGSCGASARPRAATCPNGRCATGAWMPAKGNGPSTQSSIQRFLNPRATSSPTVTQRTPAPNRESPYYTESDIKQNSVPAKASISPTAVRSKIDESPFYE